MTDVRWRKAGRSTGGNSCVELAHTRDAVRDSKNPAATALPIASIDTLLTAVKRGEFQR